MNVATFFRDLIGLLRPYWTSEERWSAFALLGGSIALQVALTSVGVGFNKWNQALFNAIQDRNLDAFIGQLMVWCLLFAALLVIILLTYYFGQILRLRWRRWMTRHLVADWLAGQAYYRQQLATGASDNPDQRIAEDVALFVDKTLELFLGFLHAVMGLFAFATILWGLSDNFQLLGMALPGFLLWAAVIYSGLASWIADAVGRKLVGLNFLHQRFEADFRFSLVRVRENAQGIALIGGEAEEERELAGHFRDVVSNWHAIIRRSTCLVVIQRARGQFSGIFAYLLMAPSFFGGTLRLGDLMQAQSAFVQFELNLSWLVSHYRDIAVWKATADRLIGFRTALRAAVGPVAARGVSEDVGEIAVRDLVLRRPDGRPLLTGLSLRFAKGSRTLVTGPSGCGKSTLFNAIAGIWPYAEGTIDMPVGARALFLPQRPYLPIAPLRQAATYPDPTEAHGDARIATALASCGLDWLGANLDEEANWSQRLSPGEQQRLAFVRALLIRPDFLFLDEATSSLDEAAEGILYRLLLTELPAAAIVSIAHRSSVKVFHSRRVDLVPYAVSVPTLAQPHQPLLRNGLPQCQPSTFH